MFFTAPSSCSSPSSPIKWLYLLTVIASYYLSYIITGSVQTPDLQTTTLNVTCDAAFWDMSMKGQSESTGTITGNCFHPA